MINDENDYIDDIFDDEYDGEKHEIRCYRLDGKNGKTKIPVKLDRDKKYQIVFITKSREGAANDYQIVLEHDLSRNVLKEVGICNVYQDF
jgi:replicative DNA helicase